MTKLDPATGFILFGPGLSAESFELTITKYLMPAGLTLGLLWNSTKAAKCVPTGKRRQLEKQKKFMRILGIDPGTGILGFGVIDVTRGKTQLVDAGVIRTPVKEDDAVRLQTIFDELTDIIMATKPTEMSVEKLFFSQNVTTAMTVSQARGVVLLCGMQAGLKISEYTPQQIKQAVTGYGKADKKQIQEIVRVILQLKEVPKPDDCADALAAAITHSMTMR